MNRHASRANVIATFALLASSALALTDEPRPVRQSPRIQSLHGFVQNRGQWADDVAFFAREGQIEATVTRDALVLRPCFDSTTLEWPAPIIVRFGSAYAREVSGESALATHHHFLLGGSPFRHAPGFERVVYSDVAPGGRSRAS